MNKNLVMDCIKLCVITLIAGLLLGIVYNVTKAPIAAQEEKTKQEAYKAVFKDAAKFDTVKLDQKDVAAVLKKNDLGQNTISEVVKAVDKNGKELGYVFSVTNPEGYGGDVSLSVGVRDDGTVNGYETLSISETAGLGMKAKEPEFKSNFKNKKADKFEVVKDGSGKNDDSKVDAISGATITSRAVTSAVNSCVANPMERLINGIVKENPTFVLMLGMCPTLAVTTSAINGAGMGLSTTAVLMFSNMIISALRNVIPDRVRIPGYIVVIASLVTIVQFLLQGYVPAVNDALGLYIPLIVVNCIILGRAESFAAKNGPINSFFDGLGMGLGFTVALTILGAFRELLGAGQIFGMQVMPSAYEPITIFILAPGAFFVLACLVAIQNKVKSKKPKKAGEVQSGGCGDCAHCGNSACGSRSFFDTTVDDK